MVTRDSWSILAEPFLDLIEADVHVRYLREHAVRERLREMGDSFGAVAGKRDSLSDEFEQRIVVALRVAGRRFQHSDALRRDLVDKLARTAGVRVDGHGRQATAAQTQAAR